MSFEKEYTRRVSNKVTDNPEYNDPAWVRPSDWLTLPTLLSTDEKIVALAAVHDNGANFVGIYATSGSYITVDWGDGSSPVNVGPDTTVYHQYDYNSSALTGTDCSRGYKQVIVTITPQSGYHIYGVDLSRAIYHPTIYPGDGAYHPTNPWLDIAVAGSYYTAGGFTGQYGYCPMLEQFIMVTPTNNIASVGEMFAGSKRLRSIQLYLPNCTGGAYGVFSGCPSLRKAPYFNTANIGYFTNMFNGCHNLTEVPLYDMSSGWATTLMFYACRNLRSVPCFNPKGVTSGSIVGLTTTTLMFYACESLETVPLFDTSNVTDASGMFYSCYSLQTLPKFNFSKNVYFDQIFLNCYSLKRIPQLDTSLGQSFSSMFAGCSRLLTIPSIDTSNGVNFTAMFSGCYQLKTVPSLTTTNGTQFNSMFYICYSLSRIPALNTSNATNMSTMFGSCYSLSDIPALNTSNNTNFATMFHTCYALRNVPGMDTTKGVNFYATFMLCECLETVGATGPTGGGPYWNYSGATAPGTLDYLATYTYQMTFFGATGLGSNPDSISFYYDVNLTSTALNRIFNGLASGTGKNIDVRNTLGAANYPTTPTYSIATGKGWTVTY